MSGDITPLFCYHAGMKTEPWMQFPDAEILQRVTVRLIEPSERERWDQLMVERHYRGNSCLVGRQLRYVAEVEGEWVGLVGWSTPVYHLIRTAVRHGPFPPQSRHPRRPASLHVTAEFWGGGAGARRTGSHG
jgi:hypothetical protein